MVMLIMHLKLTLLVLAMLPILGWVSAFFRRRMLRSARRVRHTNSRITGAYNESNIGILTTMYNASTYNLIQSALYLPVILTLVSLASGLALAVGGMELTYGAMSAGTLNAFLTYTRHFFEPVEELARWFAEMQMAQAAAERVLSLVDAQPAIQRTPQPCAPPSWRSTDERRNDWSIYGRGRAPSRVYPPPLP